MLDLLSNLFWGHNVTKIFVTCDWNYTLMLFSEKEETICINDLMREHVIDEIIRFMDSVSVMTKFTLIQIAQNAFY